MPQKKELGISRALTQVEQALLVWRNSRLGFQTLVVSNRPLPLDLIFPCAERKA